MDYRIDLLPLSQLHPHEHHNTEDAIKLIRKIGAMGVWTTPILVSADSFVILDGHHRFAAARELGLMRIPCMIVDYGDPTLEVTSWRTDLKITKRCVLTAARDGNLMPEKTSRHKWAFTAPNTSFPLPDLLHPAICQTPKDILNQGTHTNA